LISRSTLRAVQGESGRAGGGVIEALGVGGGEKIRHAPRAVSLIPIIVAFMALAVGLWWAAGSYRIGPYDFDRDAVPSVPIQATIRPQELDLSGHSDQAFDLVITSSGAPNQGAALDQGFRVSHPEAGRVANVSRPRYVRHSDVWLPGFRDDDGWVLEVPPRWSGDAFFVPSQDPPLRRRWSDVVRGLMVSAGALAFIVFWGLRYRRWRADLESYKEEMRRSGYVVD
jgi:hypothetical protein